jgi:hypothetical protein
MALMGIRRFKRFFRAAVGMDVDKDDLRRYSDFINRKVYDLLVIGQATAKANGRDVIEPWDLPVTKGLQESVRDFERMDEEVELGPILEQLAALPLLDLAYSEETEARLSALVGGLSLGLARTFKVLDPKLENPQTAHWERAFQIFDLLL